ncbi:class I SAM-dependent methyltransferase [Kordiimonas aquimaris]|uniref:class I SAM-dependent methyltransferase n=1 Tax=Kordiimonas aquimaris TaxID=707591 RepID=UPI0021D25D6D|nr:class I SAM-dependent methyltransferase [Kordiimonas aquimaris]
MANQSSIDILVNQSKQESVQAFKEHMEKSMLFRQKPRNQEYAIKRAVRNQIEGGHYIELGVATGTSCRLFAEILAKKSLTITGFDSFEGLEEDWTGIQSGRAAGAFTQSGKLPEVPANVTLVKGWVDDTLPPFLEKIGADARFAFIHMDMDTYKPTRFALEALKPFLTSGTVILFDELYGYPGWRHHEYKALLEVLDPDAFTYISFSEESVAIEIN